MKGVDIFEALPRLQSMGYEAMEVCARDGWQTEADSFSPQDRNRLAALLRRMDFPAPPVMESLDVCAAGQERTAMLRRAEASFALAGDLNDGGGLSVVTTTVGDPDPGWDAGRWQVRDGFLELADLAGRYGVIVAAESHAGSHFDTPEKAVWLMDNTRHDHLKLNFDVSHFVAQGIDVRHSVELCTPHAVHTHVKDGYTRDGAVCYQLPGEGRMDLTGYVSAVKEAGLAVPVYVEVSRQVSERPGFDTWKTAQFCYNALNKARTEAA